MNYKPVKTPTSEWSEEEIQEAVCEYYFNLFTQQRDARKHDMEKKRAASMGVGEEMHDPTAATPKAQRKNWYTDLIAPLRKFQV